MMINESGRWRLLDSHWALATRGSLVAQTEPLGMAGAVFERTLVGGHMMVCGNGQ